MPYARRINPRRYKPPKRFPIYATANGYTELIRWVKIRIRSKINKEISKYVRYNFNLFLQFYFLHQTIEIQNNENNVLYFFLSYSNGGNKHEIVTKTS